ncbi:MAG: [acyl-carrier-protein] S-malonyltransferase [Oleiphilus sp.]|nr:MAG: [acyl-carrier-protein] S-malonyltransferase [Oleiphilus sp.]
MNILESSGKTKLNEKLPLVFMYSGQGSQYHQMGRALYESDSGFRKHLRILDEKFSERLGQSVIDQMLGSSKDITDPFDRLLFTHPAIFMVSVALTNMLKDQGIEPDILVGASLGEIVAAHINGALSIDDAADIVVQQAKIVESSCREGGMLAVIGADFDYSKLLNVGSSCELASINAEGHFVLSGSSRDLDELEKYLKRKSVSYQRLPVKYAFHSCLIEGSKQSYEDVLYNVEWRTPAIKTVSCLNANFVDSYENNYLWNVARKPIQLSETFQMLEQRSSYNYLDVGVSGVMCNSARANFDSNTISKAFQLISPFGKHEDTIALISGCLTHSEKRKQLMRAYVFPGQGSQYKGMGGTIFDEFPEHILKADRILGYSTKDLCLNDPKQQLNDTQYTQPALYVVSALMYLKQVTNTQVPECVAGHSLGEFVALFASGVFDFETGLKIVQKRGELMSQAKNGGMAAVIGEKANCVDEIIRSHKLDTLDVANFNAPDQVVISGPREDIARAASVFENEDCLYVPLNVSAAFHSRYMIEAKEKFAQFLSSFQFNAPSITVMSNVTGKKHLSTDIKQNIVNQMVSSVRWVEIIGRLKAIGFDEIKEIGPGQVLTKLTGKIGAAKELVDDDQINAALNSSEINREFAQDHGSESALNTEKNLHQFDKAYTNGSSNMFSEENVGSTVNRFNAEGLGNIGFRKDYRLRQAYIAGSMHQGISSKELVEAMAKAGYLAFLGTTGMRLTEVEGDISYLRSKLTNNEPFGANFSFDYNNPKMEMALARTLISSGVEYIEVSGFMHATPALVYLRAKSLYLDSNGQVKSRIKLLSKVTRPEVAKVFLSPAPQYVLKKLLDQKLIDIDEAKWVQQMPLADDLCVEADSGGYTDMGSASSLLPSIKRLRNELSENYNFPEEIRVGLAGGIGTPESAAMAFMLGADFVVTGSINQCTVEAAVSDDVKDLLQGVGVQDTQYIYSGEMFELGAKVQVVKKGLLFPARANKLYELWRRYDSLDELDQISLSQIENNYFGCPMSDVWKEVEDFYADNYPEELNKARQNPKHKMVLIFRWYFKQAEQQTLGQRNGELVDCSIHCGPALGAFNLWVSGTKFTNWGNRNVADIAEYLMDETAAYLNNQVDAIAG